jgi:phage tail tape-measure protein
VLRRLIVLFALLALVAAPTALAAKVKIRVEGRTVTIYGAPQPTVTADNALQALDVASTAGEFHYGLTASSFGNYVSQIGKYAAAGSSGWAFKVNGASPPVGADQVALKDGDVVLWYWATFGPTGGPPTLELQRLPGNCYVVQSVDDKGVKTRSATATLVVDGKRFRTRSGRGCVGRHTGLVRAVAPGAVRSNALR